MKNFLRVVVMASLVLSFAGFIHADWDCRMFYGHCANVDRSWSAYICWDEDGNVRCINSTNCAGKTVLRTFSYAKAGDSSAFAKETEIKSLREYVTLAIEKPTEVKVLDLSTGDYLNFDDGLNRYETLDPSTFAIFVLDEKGNIKDFQISIKN